MSKGLAFFVSLFWVISSFSQNSLRIEGKRVFPVELLNYPLEKLIKEYAEKSKVRISFAKGLIKSRDKVNLVLRKEISTEVLQQYLLKVLDNHGLTLLEDAGGWSLVKTRNMRYLPTETYASSSFPETNQYIMVVHKMKYPLAREATRALRPFLSRYARIVSFGDSRTLALNEVGVKSSKLLKIVESFDTKESYQR